jgi:hypothetical protein
VLDDRVVDAVEFFIDDARSELCLALREQNVELLDKRSRVTNLSHSLFVACLNLARNATVSARASALEYVRPTLQCLPLLGRQLCRGLAISRNARTCVLVQLEDYFSTVAHNRKLAQKLHQHQHQPCARRATVQPRIP